MSTGETAATALAGGAPPGREPLSRFLLPVILLVSSLTVMASATIAPSLPGLVDHYRDVEGVQTLVRLVLTIPGLAIAVAAPFAGWLADRFGRKRIIIASIVLYILAGGAGLVLDSLGALILSRLVLGLAVAGLLPTSTALIADFWHGPARDRAFGIQAAFMAGGGVVFLPLGGFLAELSWRGPFFVYVLPILLLPFAVSVLRDAPRGVASTDAALDAGPFPTGLTALVSLIAFVGMALFYTLPVQLPFLLRELGEPSPWLAGAGLAVNTALSAIASLNFRRVRAAFGPQAILVGAFVMIGIGFVVVASADSLPMAILGLVFCGPGLGLMFPSNSTWLMAQVPARFRGRATGAMTTAVFIGQFVSPLGSQPIADAVGLSGMFMVGAFISFGFSALLLVGHLLERGRGRS
ncbi:MFS transporter [Chthonobacter rhizosphaerae]|uniref:MFS transporter n=1 Tax=Chthonobacter rhizosphaerae TaxID=2735553 RepID=UPI0015EF9C40|nr:MFS transporter [Chthonobacter rhizosphaerae]